MKDLVFLFVVCVLCSIMVGAQVSAGAISSEAHALVMSGHPQQATQTALSSERNLMGHSTSTAVRGERPLWEVMPETPAVPLGDTARALRKEHATAKKAVRVWSN